MSTTDDSENLLDHLTERIIHSASDYFAPAEYEARYRAQLKEAA